MARSSRAPTAGRGAHGSTRCSPDNHFRSPSPRAAGPYRADAAGVGPRYPAAIEETAHSKSPSPLQVVGFDHVVLNVSDVERALAFYMGELGLKPVRVDEWRRQEVFFPSVRVDDTTIIDLLAIPRTGENANHLCLVVEEADFTALRDSGRFEVVDGPDRRFGARGDGTSLYVRDPDGNTVELRYYD